MMNFLCLIDAPVAILFVAILNAESFGPRGTIIIINYYYYDDLCSFRQPLFVLKEHSNR